MIAKEGLIFIWLGLFVTAGFLFTAVKYDNKLLFSISVLFCVLTLFTTFFFRDPSREIVYNENLILSPADGKVINIERIENSEFIGGSATKISIFLSVFDVHINRIPASGKIEYIKYNPGEFHIAYTDKASELNEQTEIGMTTENGNKIIFKQIAGIIARRIVYYIDKGDVVDAGARFGMIRFGSRVEIYLPDVYQLRIKQGDKVSGGSSIIAEIIN